MIVPPCAVVKVPGTALSGSPSTSLSFAIRLTVPWSVVSSLTVAASSAATGPSLTGVTSIVSVPVSLSVPSVTVYSTVSMPLKSAGGV